MVVLYCCIRLIIHVKPQANFHFCGHWTFFDACVCVHARTSVASFSIKDKCTRHWKQIWFRIKIDAGRDGWLFALNTEALTLFHLCCRLSISLTVFLFHSTSWLPAATGLLPQWQSTVIGLSSKLRKMWEDCPGHIAVSSDCWARTLFSM